MKCFISLSSVGTKVLTDTEKYAIILLVLVYLWDLVIVKSVYFEADLLNTL